MSKVKILKGINLLVICVIFSIMIVGVLTPAIPVYGADGNGGKKDRIDFKLPTEIGQELQTGSNIRTTLVRHNYDNQGKVISNEYISELGSLPQYTEDGYKIDTTWHIVKDNSGQTYYESGINTFTARATQNGRVSIQDNREDTISAHNPTITINGEELKLYVGKEKIIDDTINDYYHGNVLEYTYYIQTGFIFKNYIIVKRQVRIIEGMLLEIFIIENNPDGELRINWNNKQDKYNSPAISNAIAYESSKNRYRIKVVNELDGLYIKESSFNDATFPVIIDPTVTVTSSAYDGNMYYDSTTSYVQAQTATTASGVSTSGTTATIGQLYTNLPGYSVWEVTRLGLYCDSSTIPDNASVNSAYIALYGYNNFSTTDFNITVQSGQPTYPSTPMTVNDFNKNYYSGDGGTLSTASFVTNAYNNIYLNSTGLSWISKTGVTKLVLRSSRDISATSPSTTEYVTVATSEYGTGFAPRLYITYTVPIIPPTVSTVSVSNLGETLVTLMGYLNDDGGESCSASFQYGTTTSYGSSSGSTSGVDTGEYISIGVTGLARGTTYHYRVIATNTAGTSYGLDSTFQTLPAVPYNLQAVAGDESVSLSWSKGDGATNTMVRFKTTGYPTSSTDGTLVYNSNGINTTHNGLTAGVTYYYSAWSVTGAGYSTTYAVAYAVPYNIGAPTVNTRDATSVGIATATLNGYLDALNQIGGDVTLSFDYGLTVAYGSSAPAGTLASPQSFYANVVGLNPASTYHFRAKAIGTNGTGYGSDFTFTTGAISAPSVDTDNATGVGLTYATLNGEISDDGGDDCNVWFIWGSSPTSLINTTDGASGVYESQPFSIILSGLAVNTLYYYQAVAENSGGIAYGNTCNFTMLSPSLPTVETLSSTSSGSTIVTVYGILLNSGGELCDVQFQWDTDNVTWGNSTGWQSAKNTGETISAIISGLTPTTTYYYRLVAKNTIGTTNATYQTFTTVFLPPSNFTAKSLGSTSIGLTWNTNGDKTLVLVKTSGYPVDRLDGTQVYLGADSSVTHSSLVSGVTYFYKAWSWQSGDVWSTDSSYDASTTSSISLGLRGDAPSALDLGDISGAFQTTDDSKLASLPLYNEVVVNLSEYYGMPSGLVALFILLITTVVLCIFTWMLSHSIWAILGITLFMMFLGWVLGIVPFVFVVIMIIICLGFPYLKTRFSEG